ncbi:MAG: hypothetical protein CVV52_01080 [Spirochaetae bacterium HGW-Spirochaetae-8]|nr:MAG: hypothetical protein CVV52_01080 [Spirochaetae bacterium HGW-Spirochaetae-8]
MNSKERVLTALSVREPDRVPFMFAMVDTQLQEEIVGHALRDYVFDIRKDPGTVTVPGESVRTSLNYCIHPETAGVLGLDALGIKFNYPLFVKATLQRGGWAIERGLLVDWEAFHKVTMPDPDQEDVLREAQRFINRYGQDRAIYAAIRMGISSTLMSMGYDVFSYMLYDDREFIQSVLGMYLDFNKRFIHNLEEIGFDFLWSFDDIAFGTAPFFSPQVWDEVFFKPVKAITTEFGIPWIYHSDGNILPLLDRMLPLGMSGIHPLEPGSMDLDYLKRTYGKRICLIGNLDINSTLSSSSPSEVRLEVLDRIARLSPGGGFILSDSNSIPYFCSSRNLVEAANTVRDFNQNLPCP